MTTALITIIIQTFSYNYLPNQKSNFLERGFDVLVEKFNPKQIALQSSKHLVRVLQLSFTLKPLHMCTIPPEGIVQSK